MRLLAALALSVSLLMRAAAQDGGAASSGMAAGSAMIEARQAEVARIGQMIYRVHLEDPSWTREQVPVCPAFKHYVFARYENKAGSLETTSYLAIYPLDSMPTQSVNRPWRGGILLQPLYPPLKYKGVPTAERNETIDLFNRLWADELKRSGQNALDGVTWLALADCYARFANEQPVSTAEDEANAPAVDLSSNTVVNGILAPVEPVASIDRSLLLSFSKRGLITSAEITTAPHATVPAQ